MSSTVFPVVSHEISFLTLRLYVQILISSTFLAHKHVDNNYYITGFGINHSADPHALSCIHSYGVLYTVYGDDSRGALSPK